MGGVALDHLDQRRDDVMTALELGVDVGPGPLGSFLQPDEPVVEDGYPGQQCHEQTERPQHESGPSGVISRSVKDPAHRLGCAQAIPLISVSRNS